MTLAPQRRCWIAVASADHVARGVAGGFMQACHGKAAPLRKMQAGDAVVYYSPTQAMGVKDAGAPLQSFTALGTVAAGEPYVFDMGGGFVPWRRDVAWAVDAQAARIRPLLPHMAWTAGKTNWAAPLRFGVLAIDAADFKVIAAAIQTTAPSAPPSPLLTLF